MHQTIVRIYSYLLIMLPILALMSLILCLPCFVIVLQRFYRATGGSAWQRFEECDSRGKVALSQKTGTMRYFENLHQRLPEDIVFSALSDTLGWDPIHEAFGKLGNRERWPIPWIEDDPSMWFP